MAQGFLGSSQHVPEPAAHSTGNPFHTVQPPQTQSSPGWQQFSPHSSEGGGGGQQPRLLKQIAVVPPGTGSSFLVHLPAQHSSPSSQHSLSSFGSSSASSAHSLAGLLQQLVTSGHSEIGSWLSGMQPMPQQLVPVMQQSSLHLPSALSEASVQRSRCGLIVVRRQVSS